MSKTIIIAEAGVNHNGDITLAKKLIDIASDSGADYVKFQTFKAEKLVNRKAQKADYQIRNTGKMEESQFEMLQKLELSEDAHKELIQYCKSKNIRFLSTAFDLDSLDFLAGLGLKLFKIPSGELTNLPFLLKVAELADTIVLSTGMSTLEEVRETMGVLRQHSSARIYVLHCNTEYPTPYEDVNLLAMNALARELDVETGFSDHTLGIEVPVAAVALGAKIIEKHFTIDRSFEGPDHRSSLEPQELCAMVKAIRNIEKALGSEEKRPSPAELKNRLAARKSIHLLNNLSQGSIISAGDLIMMRPGDGISPMLMATVIGREVKTDLPAEHKLSFKDFY